MPIRNVQSRRSLLGSLAGLILLPTQTRAQTPVATPDADDRGRPAPIDLDQGIALTDFRIIPGSNPTRYLIEIENQRDDIIDTPTVGAVIANAPSEESFTWASPWHYLLRPGQSTFCTGTLMQQSAHLDDFAWQLCSDIGQFDKALATARTWEYTITSSTEIVSDDAIRVNSRFTNEGAGLLVLGELRGMIRDQHGRICGGIPQTTIPQLTAGESGERSVGFSSTWGFELNPFMLCKRAEDMTAEVDLQRRPYGVQPGCQVVMPWNRVD